VRFVVDQCVPVEVARWLARQSHEAWTAYDAGLGDAADEDLIAYAHAKGAVLVTTNRDCAQLARWLRTASVLWLAVREYVAQDAASRAVNWLAANILPNGRVPRSPRSLHPSCSTRVPFIESGAGQSNSRGW
jgi:predicted nuclease of predicted toxin-antitoxin system